MATKQNNVRMMQTRKHKTNFITAVLSWSLLLCTLVDASQPTDVTITTNDKYTYSLRSSDPLIQGADTLKMMLEYPDNGSAVPLPLAGSTVALLRDIHRQLSSGGTQSIPETVQKHEIKQCITLLNAADFLASPALLNHLTLQLGNLTCAPSMIKRLLKKKTSLETKLCSWGLNPLLIDQIHDVLKQSLAIDHLHVPLKLEDDPFITQMNTAGTIVPLEMAFIEKRENSPIITWSISTDRTIGVTAHTNKTVKIWHIFDQSCSKIVGPFLCPINAVMLSPEGHTLAISLTNSSVTLFDINRGEHLFGLENPNRDYNQIFFFNPTGDRLVVVNSSSSINIVSIPEKKLIPVEEIMKITKARWRISDDNKLLCCFDASGFLCIWEVATGKSLAVRPIDTRVHLKQLITYDSYDSDIMHDSISTCLDTALADYQSITTASLKQVLLAHACVRYPELGRSLIKKKQYKHMLAEDSFFARFITALTDENRTKKLRLPIAKTVYKSFRVGF